MEKACCQASIMWIFFGLEIGSRQREAGRPASEFWREIWYLSRTGWLSKLPKSTYSSSQIFPLSLSLAETRDSMGKLEERKTWVGTTEFATIEIDNNWGSPVIREWAAYIAPFIAPLYCALVLSSSKQLANFRCYCGRCVEYWKIRFNSLRWCDFKLWLGLARTLGNQGCVTCCSASAAANRWIFICRLSWSGIAATLASQGFLWWHPKGKNCGERNMEAHPGYENGPRFRQSTKFKRSHLSRKYENQY